MGADASGVKVSDELCCVPVHARTEEESALMQATEVLMDKLTKEAYEVAMVSSFYTFLALWF